MIRTDKSESGPGRARRTGAIVLFGALGWLTAAGSARAQTPDLLISLSQDDATVSETVRDEELAYHAVGFDAHVAWPAETLALLAGDGGNPLHVMLSDVDAVHDGGGQTPADGLLISTPSNEAGFLDGDVLGFDPGGLYVVLAEPDVAVAVGASDGNVDVDAIQRDPDGTWIFSLADNEVSTTLSGDDPGMVKDGAVLSWAPGAATAAVLYTESQMDAMVSHALGSATTITDTFGLARDPATGAILFSVQSPSAHDASVFTTAGGGALLAGHSESDLGFTGAPELDALSIAVSRFPAITVSNGLPQPGETLVIGLADAEPGRPHVVLVAMDTSAPAFVLSGWGGFVLAQDALLAAALAAAPSLAVVPDALGKASMISVLPAAMLPVDVVLQVVAPGSGPAGSNPLLLELAQ